MEALAEPGPGGPEAAPERPGLRRLVLSDFRKELKALLVLAGPAVSQVALAGVLGGAESGVRPCVHCWHAAALVHMPSGAVGTAGTRPRRAGWSLCSNPGLQAASTHWDLHWDRASAVPRGWVPCLGGASGVA